MTSAIDGYVKGKLSGANLYRARQKDPGAKSPENPFPPSDYLAYVEWDRGFNDGFEQAARQGMREAA